MESGPSSASESTCATFQTGGTLFRFGLMAIPQRCTSTFFLASVGESERIRLRKDHLPRVENSQISKWHSQWHSPAAYDLNDRSVRRKKSFNLCSVVIIMQRYAEPIAELQEIHYISWISLTQLLHVLSVAIEVDFNLAFQLGRPKPLRKMEPSCLGSICRLPMIGFKV